MKNTPEEEKLRIHGGINLNRAILFSFILLFLLMANCIPLSSSVTQETQESAGFFRVPSYLQIGDLLFCDVHPAYVAIKNKLENIEFSTTPGYSNDHVAMYIGNNRFIEATPYIYRPIQKNWLGVVTTPYWFLNLWSTNITFGFVTNATTEEKENAIAWAKEQLRSPYQFDTSTANPNPQDSEDIFSDWWFCSELVWAAYYNQGVPITISWGHFHFNASFVRGLRVADNVKMYTNIAPTANTGGPYVGIVNESIHINGDNSTDIDGRIIKHSWDFGDGTNGTGRHTSHIYKEPGEYVLQLTVVDNADETDNDTTSVIIT